MINYTTISLPTPFIVGPVNSYIIKNDPVTLIDCGLFTSEAKLALIQEINLLGLTLEDIKRIIITHAHPDHFGLAGEVQNISGASIYMHKKEVHKARNWFKHNEQVVSYLAYAGLPEKLCNCQLEYFNEDGKFIQTPKKIIEVEDGHDFYFDNFTLKGILTPGHSTGHLCLFQENEGLLFSGDTLLENINPKPVLEPIAGQAFLREKSLIQYINSLKYLEQLNINRILPGHGAPFFDIFPILERFNGKNKKRYKQVRDLACIKRIFNPYDLIEELYPNFRRPIDVSMAMSEVLGHLDLLEAEGQIIQEKSSTGLLYSWK